MLNTRVVYLAYRYFVLYILYFVYVYVVIHFRTAAPFRRGDKHMRKYRRIRMHFHSAKLKRGTQRTEKRYLIIIFKTSLKHPFVLIRLVNNDETFSVYQTQKLSRGKQEQSNRYRE
jgi:hypothetical protein